MKNFYVFLIAVLIGSFGFAQTTIYSQDFENDLVGYSHTPSQTPSSDPGDQYFHRAEPSDGAIYESGGPYTNVTNSWFFVGSNPNTINAGSPGILNLGALIDVSGFSDLELLADFGGVPNDWDATDELRVEYSSDNSNWSLLYSFRSPVTNDPLELENNVSGGSNTTNGTTLTYALQTIFSNNFTGISNDLYLRIVCNSGANYEAFGVDNIILQGIPTSSCTAPTTQATVYNTTALATTSATLNWTPGDGDEVLVVVKEGAAVDADPTNGTSYTADTAFGSGDEIGTGNFAVFADVTASSVSITALNAGTTYHVAVYEYNTTDTCYLTPALVGSFTTDCTIPSIVTALTATPGNTTIDLSWATGGCFDEILVVAKEATAVTVTPTGDGTAYTADANFGDGTDLGSSEFAVFKGTGTSVNVTGLTNGTTYHFSVFTRKASTWSTGNPISETPVSTPVAGNLVISEIMYNSSGTDDEWIEIYNASGSDITLDADWRLTYDGSTFDFGGTLITAGSYLTIAVGSNGDGTYNNDNPFTPDVTTIATPATIAATNNSNNIVNSTATIALIFDPSGFNVTIDTVTFDDGSPWPTTPDGDGPSLELIDLSSDNSLAASWTASSDYDGGTPGTFYSQIFMFDGTSWSPFDPIASPLTSGTETVIIESGAIALTASISVNTVTVNPGASLTIDSAITLTTADPVDGLTLESTSSSFSSLINDGTISGTINYERFVNAIGSGAPGNGGNDLISAPIGTDTPGGYVFQDLIDNASNSTIIASSGTQFAFAPFNNTDVAYENYEIIGGPPDPSQTLVAGQGFRVATTSGANVTFSGPFSSATVSIGITNPGAGSQWNLIGNPYPSYISSLAFLTTNTAILDDTVLDPAASAIYAYNAGTYTGSDDTIGNFTIINNNTNAALNIAPGQGFYVASDATGGSVQFLPAMRTTAGSDDFIEGRSSFQNYKLVLGLEANENTSTSFYFNENSTRGLDPGYDAAAFGENAISSPIYSHLVEDNTGRAMAMQSLGSSDFEDIAVALGVNSNQGNQVRFSINESTLPSTVNVYLEDQITNTMTLLNTSEYVFTPTTNLSGTGRFFLHFADSALSNGNNSLEALNIYTNKTAKTIVIAGQLLEATKAKVYDLQGRMVTSAQLETSKISQSIDTSNLSTGVYVIQLTDATTTKSQKIIIR